MKPPGADGRGRHRVNALGVGRSSHGYVRVRVGTGHPLADPNGWCYLHTLVAMTALGRPILPSETVHHRNGDMTDNRWENLEVITRGEHNRVHNKSRGRDALGRFVS